MKLLEKSNRNLRLKEELLKAMREAAVAYSIEKDEAKKAKKFSDLVQASHKVSELFEEGDLTESDSSLLLLIRDFLDFINSILEIYRKEEAK
nr:hypothetical protein [uncultured Mediterranean phage uvMED]